MSKATKRKYVFKELEDPNITLETGQEVAKVEASRGNNLHEVRTVQGETFLASMPRRFRRNAWIKRGDFVVLERIQEGVKVQAEITKILYKEHIEQMRKEGIWPSQFEFLKADCEKDSLNGEDLFVNTNRQPPPCEDSESSSDEEDTS